MKRLGGGFGRQARIPRVRTPKRETAKSGRMQGGARSGEASAQRDKQTVQRRGSAADLAGREAGSQSCPK